MSVSLKGVGECFRRFPSDIPPGRLFEEFITIAGTKSPEKRKNNHGIIVLTPLGKEPNMEKTDYLSDIASYLDIQRRCNSCQFLFRDVPMLLFAIILGQRTKKVTKQKRSRSKIATRMLPHYLTLNMVDHTSISQPQI